MSMKYVIINGIVIETVNATETHNESPYVNMELA